MVKCLEVMFGRLSFFPTLGYNVLMERCSSRRWWDRIDSTVVLGALPFRGMVGRLKDQEGVVGVVSMNEDYELKLFSFDQQGYAQHGIQFLQLPTRDIFEAPCQDKLRQGVQFIQNLQGQGSVYVHCKAGRTRSATLVACYLLNVHQNWTPAQAVQFIRSKRPHILLGPKQNGAIEAYYQSIRKNDRTKPLAPQAVAAVEESGSS